MTGSELSTIFFSYSRGDRKRAEPIIRLIEQAGHNVWWDGLLEGGERFSRTTEEALERAKAVVVLWSKTSVQSHWVHDEATRGRDRGLLVPLSLDGSMPPLGFGQFQVIDLSKAKLNAKDETIQRMLRAIAAMQGAEVAAVVRPSPAPVLRRRALIIGSAAVVLAGGGFTAWRQRWFPGQGSLANRIAVLPFANISGDPKQDYLAEGLSTEIRSTLAQNGALQVVGQASSEAFAERKSDLVTMARQLNVDYLLGGSVRTANGDMRVTIELSDGNTGIARPPRSFDTQTDNVLLVQREIANAIAAELTSTLGAGANAPVGGTSNVIAFDHYLRGKNLYANAKDEAEEREAVTQFEAAIAADPKFAAAYAGKSRALMAVSSQYGGAAEIKKFYDAAIASAQQAVALAPTLADAQSTLAYTLYQGLDIASAKKPFEQARKSGEGEGSVMARYALYAAATGHDKDAVPAIERALTLDPLNALFYRVAAVVEVAARRYPDALRRLRDAEKIKPDLSETHARIAMVLLAQGKNAEALTELKAEKHKWSRLAGEAIAHRRLGNVKAAEAAMAGLTNDKDVVSLFQQGQVLAQWGKPDEAIEALGKAYQQRDAGMTTARYDPMLDPLRKHPRFIALLKTMGFD
jgi:TolB-like protein